ncbi:MAG: UDP-N-acetylmuramoylalanyl-D-glutamyl-2,6-diaminopimelate--D-alanyl-D-alanine ligase [Pseudomonadota bacterium]
MLWRTDKMVEAMGARIVSDVPEGITGLSIDTRTLQPGDAYFAIKGDVHDGHKFTRAAGEAGAGLAVVSEEKLAEVSDAGVGLLVVDDVLKALERLAVAARARSNAKIIAVTGSVGKTGTKDAVRHVLARSGTVHASAASFNNHWGVPLTLARLPDNADFGVFEVGMNRPGEITPLVKMVRPHVAIITTVAAAHLGAFKDVSEIAHAKAEIFNGLEPDGTAVLNIDNDQFDLLMTLAGNAGVSNVLTFGENERADMRLVEFSSVDDGSDIQADLSGQRINAHIAMPGRHVAQNALAVLAAAHLAGADLKKSADALADLPAPIGRGQRHHLAIGGGSFTVIDESYNANPASMKAALAMLAETAPGAGGRRIAVLGDMLELGVHSDALHEEIAAPLAQSQADHVLLAGPLIKSLVSKVPSEIECVYKADTPSLAPELMGLIRAGDVVLLKASNGLKFNQLIKSLIETYPAVGGSGIDRAATG